MQWSGQLFVQSKLVPPCEKQEQLVFALMGLQTPIVKIKQSCVQCNGKGKV